MKDTEGTENPEVGNIYISSEQIIQEVQKFRCLYDPADPDHKDRDVVRDAWLSVTQAVVGEPWNELNQAERNEAAGDVERRWRSVRESLRKALNKSRKTRKPGLLTKELTTVSDAENSRSLSDTENTAAAQEAEEPTKTPVRVLRPKRNTSFVDYLEDSSGTFESDGLSETSDSSPSPGKRKRKSRRGMQTAQKNNCFVSDQPSVPVTCTPELNSFSGVNYPCYPSTFVPEPENPDRMFLLSLLPRLSALSSRNKLDFQIKAMQLLRGYEKEEESKSKE